ncbi:hypothetical protein AAMO2058_000839000 [Amorphochlora amoebiformis]
MHLAGVMGLPRSMVMHRWSVRLACSEIPKGVAMRGLKTASTGDGRPVVTSRNKLGQNLNMEAIRSLGSVLRKPSVMVPHISTPNVNSIPFRALKSAGIKVVVFDKDNTITAPYSFELHDTARKGLAEAQKLFGKENVILMSNSAGTLDDDGFREADIIEHELGLPVLRHKEKKPKGMPELTAHFTGKIEPAEMCIVGDRVLTDVLFGSLNGLLTIHVSDPLDVKSDNKMARFWRVVENSFLLPILKILGVGPPPTHRGVYSKGLK